MANEVKYHNTLVLMENLDVIPGLSPSTVLESVKLCDGAVQMMMAIIKRPFVPCPYPGGLAHLWLEATDATAASRHSLYAVAAPGTTVFSGAATPWRNLHQHA